MTGWTTDTGTVTSVTTAPGDVTVNREGSYFFYPAALGQGVDSQISQVINVAVADETAIDVGRCYAIARFMQITHDQTYDFLTITLEALNAADGSLGTISENIPVTPGSGWHKTGMDIPLSLPTLTRKVKITILFDANALGSVANSVYIDDISIDILEIE
jgi:hypothetical protein